MYVYIHVYKHICVSISVDLGIGNEMVKGCEGRSGVSMKRRTVWTPGRDGPREGQRRMYRSYGHVIEGRNLFKMMAPILPFSISFSLSAIIIYDATWHTGSDRERKREERELHTKLYGYKSMSTCMPSRTCVYCRPVAICKVPDRRGRR